AAVRRCGSSATPRPARAPAWPGSIPAARAPAMPAGSSARPSTACGRPARSSPPTRTRPDLRGRRSIDPKTGIAERPLIVLGIIEVPEGPELGVYREHLPFVHDPGADQLDDGLQLKVLLLQHALDGGKRGSLAIEGG